ncbi:unnamed protein product [Mytilus edulis]|uniref:Novel STAND NTPase 3 domain-containing protein n=1 Tax=Mytilus edulis TaxID=6550 RepID=A0A8S3U858_MYTED|nr:unnamed protein product [Mytilus edulis]
MQLISPMIKEAKMNGGFFKNNVVSLSIQGTDEMIDDESVTVVANGLQEFQKETLREWSCKLNKFVPTRGADIIYNNTKSENVVIIVGPTGIGKSSIAYYAAYKLKQEDGYTIQPVRQPLDIQKLHVPGKNQIFIIDDFIGKSAVNQKAAVLWKNNETLFRDF